MVPSITKTILNFFQAVEKIKYILLFITLHSQFNGNAQSLEQHYLYEIGITDGLYSSALKEQRTIWVQMPASYHPGNQAKYPVVYILDGGVCELAVESTIVSFEDDTPQILRKGAISKEEIEAVVSAS